MRACMYRHILVCSVDPLCADAPPFSSLISGQSGSSSASAVQIAPLNQMEKKHICVAGREAGAPPPVSEPPSIQTEPPQEDGSLLPSSCALPPTLKSNLCLSTTIQLMQALSRHLTMTHGILKAMHLIPSLPVGASQTGEWGLLHFSKFTCSFGCLQASVA